MIMMCINNLLNVFSDYHWFELLIRIYYYYTEEYLRNYY